MRSKSVLNRKLQVALGSAMFALLVVGAISYRGMVLSRENARWVSHTHEVLECVHDLVFAVESIESNSRGFESTGKQSYLDAYRVGLQKVSKDQAVIRTLTLDNAEQQRQLPVLENLTVQKIRRADLVMSQRLARGPGLDASRNRPSQETTDEFLSVVGNLQAEELRLLALRNTTTDRRVSQTKVLLVLGTILGLLIAVVAGWSVQHDNSARGRAEGALSDSEEKYRMLLDGVQDYAIFMLDPLGRVVNWNAGAERIKGYTAEQIIGQNFSCFFTPEDIKRDRPQDVLRKTAADGRHQENAMRVRKDGSQFLASITFTALRDADGSLRGFSEISRDLSESKESEAKYRGLLEAAPDAMVVVNENGEIVLLNVQAEKRFGYSRDELIGQKVKNIIPKGFAERLIADGTRSAAEALAQQIGTGIELTGRRKDGSQFPIEIMLSPLENTDAILVTAAIRDITVRKAAEEHLAQMEAKYRGLLEAAPDAMVVVNENGEIVLLNVQAEKRFGYSRDELIGQKVKNIIPKGFAERLIADGTRSAAEALAQQIGTGIELTGRRKDGSHFPIEIMLSPLENTDAILVTAAIRDITVRKAAEEHLAHMEAKYRGLLEAAPDAMIVVNESGEIVLVNVQAEKRFGYSRDELIGQKVTNIIPKGFAERLLADGTRSAAEALAQQIGTGIELTGRRKDGSHFPIELMLSPLENADAILVTAAIRDITVRKAAEEHLAHMEAKYRGLLEAAPDAMVVVSPRGKIVLLNVQAEKRFGYSRDELVGKQVKTIIPHGFAERLIADSLRSEEDALDQQIGTGIDLTGQRKDGTEFPIEIMLSPLEGDEGVLVTAAIRDITARKRAEALIIHSAEHDFLTGLPNRMLLNDRVNQAILLALRHRRKVAVLFLDLDGFKHINDSLGHSTGDKLLQSVGKRLVDCIRGSDTVSRQGGDEFVVLLSEEENSEDASVIARRMLRAVAEAHCIDEHDLHITCSVGISLYPDDGVDAETLIKNADTAMYQAKENGRQTYQFFKPAMNVRAVERQSIEEGLRRALERQEFVVHYQPKIDLKTGRISGAEALLRWNHPTRGAVSPGQFIPVAEDCGLILPIGSWVLRQACQQAQAWLAAGLPMGTMAVNISAMQLREEKFVDNVLAMLKETGLHPKFLEVELTESVLMKHAESTAAKLSELRAHGIQVAVDDFGTGYSSLSYLSKFPIDALKIDQSFVNQITTVPDETIIVNAVISMGRSLKLRVVAEGVETQKQLSFLQAHKCDEAQGYFFSRPVPAEQFAKLLKAGIASAASAK